MKKQLFSLALAATLAISATSFASPLHIAKQGMFSAGGITITSPGTFDPYDQWEATQQIPVAFYFGDYIHNGDPKLVATKIWQNKLQECEAFAANYNNAGGKSVVFDLQKEGIYGNDHFMFQSLNNDVIAKHIEKWMRSLK